MGPSAYAGGAGIMSGRTSQQQGLTATCEDLTINGTTGEVRSGEVWRMSPYERRRRGNALPDDLRGRSGGSNAPIRQRGSGHSVAAEVRAHPDTELGVLRPVYRREGSEQTCLARGEVRVSAAVLGQEGRPALTNGVQSRGQNRIWGIRPSGIAGGPLET